MQANHQASFLPDIYDEKRASGRYYTITNPFDTDLFKQWLDMSEGDIIEPFAGSNNLVQMLREIGVERRITSYDIAPKNPAVQMRDTLKDFPIGFEACVTNPPYLYKTSARKNGFAFPETIYDDIYKYALQKCLDNCPYVAAIIPASFLMSGLFRNRLWSYILLSLDMFDDTDHPVCLALFVPSHQNDSSLCSFKSNGVISDLSSLHKVQSYLEQNLCRNLEIRFNVPSGEIGLIGIDNTYLPTIRFCAGDEIDSSIVKYSSRSITRIKVNKSIKDSDIDNLNSFLDEYREETFDYLLTPFKGLRKDGKYRRRLDFDLARKMIQIVVG